MQIRSLARSYPTEVYATINRLELEPDEFFTAEEKAVSYNRMKRAIRKQQNKENGTP